MIIIGAGMAGLIAGHYFRLHQPLIIEAQKSLPHNHDALLRFRSDVVAKVTGIDFKKVKVYKSIYSHGKFHDRCDPRLANAYARKVTDTITNRSIWDNAPAERYIAPADFVNRAARDLRISYSNPVTSVEGFTEPVISTVPMPTLMKMAGWKDIPKFSYRPIWTIKAEIAEPYMDVYQTIHYPDQKVPYYRASITGKTIIIESATEVWPHECEHIIHDVAMDFGLFPYAIDGVHLSRQEYGKIVSDAPDVCQDFIYTMTREHNIYSLGRFATWRQLLLDDVVGDCKIIERLIQYELRRSSYHDALRLASTHPS